MIECSNHGEGSIYLARRVLNGRPVRVLACRRCGWEVPEAPIEPEYDELLDHESYGSDD